LRVTPKPRWAERQRREGNADDNSAAPRGDTRKLELDIPRDRRGSFEPQLIAKYQRRFPRFDDKIVSMYARGMSMRDQGHLRELYGIDASPQLISTVTDACPYHGGVAGFTG
jgi:transposase-like protein